LSAKAIRVVVGLVLAAALAIPGIAPASPTPRASLTDIENDVMCVACRTSLAVSESPQAYQEKSFIQRLINRGQTKAQIEHALVTEYGSAVLALPPAHGFNLTVYILPPALVLAGVAVLAVTLPRWRRRTRAQQSGGPASAPRPDPADARRLDDELTRYDA
jgi:cytochrome c-type biogenesis protein CcmH/NrfF